MLGHADVAVGLKKEELGKNIGKDKKKVEEKLESDENICQEEKEEEEKRIEEKNGSGTNPSAARL